MPFNSSEWANKYKLTIDSSKVDEDLTDFPVSIVLSSGTGQTGFDVSDIFDELTVVSGQDGFVDDYTKLLLHCGGDLSDSKHDITVNGNPIIENCTISGVDKHCMDFDGTGDYLTIPANTDFVFGTGLFTIDFWVNCASWVNYTGLISNRAGAMSNSMWTLEIWDTAVELHTGSAQIINSGVLPSNGVWHHMAVVREGTGTNQTHIYLDGTNIGSGTLGYDLNSLLDVNIGYDVNGSVNTLNGSMSEIRISKGIARWTSNFTPPTSVTNDSYTKFLLGFDGDSSGSEHAVTFNGNPVIEQNAGKFDGCYSFDGTGDSVELFSSSDFAFGNDPFTVDFWMKTSSASTVRDMLISFSTTYTVHEVTITLGSTTVTDWNSSSGSVLGLHISYTSSWLSQTAGTTSVTDGAWHHVALVRDGTSFKVYLDGIVEISATATHTIIAQPMKIAMHYNDRYFNGYISEIRISKGIARWTSNFTPPGDKYGTNSWFNRKKIAITTTVSGVETELYTEIANWDSEDEIASLWTKVPTIVSGTDTELMLYYDTTQSGNTTYVGDTGDTPAQNVWSNNFAGVWHMEQDPSGGSNCMLDSTSNENHGTPNGGMTTDDFVEGKIANALDFDGGTDCLSIDYDTSVDIVNAVTIESVISPSAAGTNRYILSRGDYNQLDTKSFEFVLYSNNELRFRRNASNTVYSLSTIGTLDYSGVAVTYDSGGSGQLTNMYINGSNDTDTSSNPTGSMTSTGDGVTIGLNPGASTPFSGIMDEVRLSDVGRTSSWIKASYDSNWNNLITFSDVLVCFTFFNQFPSDSSTAYGVSKDLKINVTVTGTDIYDLYDAEFYNGSNDIQIGSTVSGVSNNAQASVYLSTPSGIEYSWYVKATSSGEEGTSGIYTFDNRFLCHGYVEDQGARASGVPVRLYRRSTGDLVGSATTTGTAGSFDIESEFNEYHYSTALYDSSDTNALIYDWIIPE